MSARRAATANEGSKPNGLMNSGSVTVGDNWDAWTQSLRPWAGGGGGERERELWIHVGIIPVNGWNTGALALAGLRELDWLTVLESSRQGGEGAESTELKIARRRGGGGTLCILHTGVFKEESRLGLPLIAWACTVLSLSLVLVYRSFSLLLLAFLFSAYLLFLSFVFLSPPLTLTLSHYKNQGFPSFQIPLAFLFIKLCFLSPLPPHTLSFCVFALVIVFLLLFSLLTLSWEASCTPSLHHQPRFPQTPSTTSHPLCIHIFLPSNPLPTGGPNSLVDNHHRSSIDTFQVSNPGSLEYNSILTFVHHHHQQTWSSRLLLSLPLPSWLAPLLLTHGSNVLTLMWPTTPLPKLTLHSLCMFPLPHYYPLRKEERKEAPCFACLI